MSPPAPLDVDLRGDSDTSSVPFPDPLTVDSVLPLRAKAPKIPLGVAAASSSDMFKSPVCWIGCDTLPCTLVALVRRTLYNRPQG